MLKINRIHINKRVLYTTIFLIVLLAGLMNSSAYFNFMGLTKLNSIIRNGYYLLLVSLIFFLGSLSNGVGE